MKRDTVWLEWLVLGVFGLWLFLLLVRVAAHGELLAGDVMGILWWLLAAGLTFGLLFTGSLVLDAWRWLTKPFSRKAVAQDSLLRRFLANRTGSRLVRTADGTEEAEVPCRDETVGVSVLADGRVAAWVPVEGEQARSLDLGRTTLPKRVKDALGIDQKGPDALAGCVVDQRAEEALRLLFGPFQCRRLWLAEGKLHAETGLSSAVVSAGWLDQVLDGLLRVAALLDTMQVVVRKVAPRTADRTLCPYCHDDIAGASRHDPSDVSRRPAGLDEHPPTDGGAPRQLGSPLSTSCPACGTVHHSECWEEGAGCTILGCARNPRKGQPVRVR